MRTLKNAGTILAGIVGTMTANIIAFVQSLSDWTPPALTLPERIWLGGEIAKVGRKAFATSLKRSLSDSSNWSNCKPLRFDEILRDAERLRDGKNVQPPISRTAAALLLLVFGGGVAFLIAAALNSRYLAAVAVAGTVSIGSLFWMSRKIERWAQKLIDEYSQSVANCNLRAARPSAQCKRKQKLLALLRAALTWLKNLTPAQKGRKMQEEAKAPRATEKLTLAALTWLRNLTPAQKGLAMASAAGAVVGIVIGFANTDWRSRRFGFTYWLAHHFADVIMWAVVGAMVVGAAVYCYRVFSAEAAATKNKQ
jgi:hypothetical protein